MQQVVNDLHRNHGKTIGKWWFHGIFWDLPSGHDLQFAIEIKPCLVDLSIENMVIFHGYVSLAEGIKTRIEVVYIPKRDSHGHV